MMADPIRKRRAIRGGVTLLMVTAGCGGSLRTAPTGPHSDRVPPMVIDSPPPPAKVERVPEDPGEPCVWLDGRWEWRGGVWEWQPGAWVIPPRGCYYARPLALWVPTTGTGTLFYRPGAWYSGRHGSICAEPKQCGAPTEASES